MLIGVPKEIKDNESRVAVTPAGVESMVRQEHEVFLQAGAGLGSGIGDEAYVSAGARILNTGKEIFDAARMVMKVKEPLPQEYGLLKEGLLLFAFLHLAREPELTKVLLEKKVAAVACETIQLQDGSLPILMPMSAVAGRMAVQIGAQFLEKPKGGRGILLGGVPGVPAGNVVIIGGGIVGTNAAKMALGLGARVTIIDCNVERLAYLDDIFAGCATTVVSNSFNIAEAVRQADLLIGAVLIPGAKCPSLVTEEMVKTMKPGSVIVDVAVDQGGVVETIDRVTTYSRPVYEKYGVLHCAVPNIPAAVPRTSTFALAAATLPYALELARQGDLKAVTQNPALARGINTLNGFCTYKAVAEALNLQYAPLQEALAEL